MASPNHKEPPWIHSEYGNVVVGLRRPKSREGVTSSSSNSTAPRRPTSPLGSRPPPVKQLPPPSAAAKRTPSVERRRPNTPGKVRPNTPGKVPATPLPLPPSAVAKRSQSTERRRPSTPGNSVERLAAAKVLGTLSTRSLPFSFQEESFSVPINKTKPAPAPTTNQLSSARQGTPERSRPVANSKSIDQRQWPGRALKQSVIDDGTPAVDQVASDTESIYSENNGYVQGRRSVARFLEETNKPKNTLAPLKINVTNKLYVDSSPISTPKGVSSSRGFPTYPILGPPRPASPSRRPTSLASSTPRGRMPSSFRMRSGVTSALDDNLSNTPSILSFGGEVRRGGKVGENRIVDAHMLRVLDNRYLQWQFVNARVDAEMLFRRKTEEKSLYSAWVTTLKLRRSIVSKRVELQLQRQSLKLYSILKGQMLCLNDWDLIEGDNSSSLSGAAEALESSTLRLPVVGGGRADIKNVKDAIHSAVDVVQAMASPIGALMTKVDKMNSLVRELASITSKERALLGKCEDLLSMLTAMQVTMSLVP
ncbi:hypothetical protein Vadar_016507 [Vaccinium darrowii]|uniref:Uncharacterized protein n=1 Tax=Vaccinium darrowii TaxID=229202 RepID=A0ACB7Y8H9_9ERIC|nr:hypothetical protein Vadar_016507 [Vaccinium darrowii]